MGLDENTKKFLAKSFKAESAFVCYVNIICQVEAAITTLDGATNDKIRLAASTKPKKSELA